MTNHDDEVSAERKKKAAAALSSKKRRLSAGWVRLDMLVPTAGHRKTIQRFANQLVAVSEDGTLPALPADEILAKYSANLSMKGNEILERVYKILAHGDPREIVRLENRVVLSEYATIHRKPGAA